MTQPNKNLVDARLKVTKALPNGAAAVNSDGIDTEVSDNGVQVGSVELKISAPALTVSALPNAKTMTYKVQHDTDSAFGTPVTLADAVLVQTGAAGAGAVAAEARLRLPTDAKRYIRVVATGSASGDASGVSMTVALVV